METTNFENKFFDFEKVKVQPLSLEQLQRTHKENDVYGKPLKGIYHFDLMSQVIAMCNAAGYNADVWDLFAAQNRDKSAPGVVLLPQIEQIHGEKAIEAHILRRVYANIRLTDFDDANHTTNLSVAFHQQGIQVGFGNMVKICHNQCMLSATQYAATYSERGQGRGKGLEIPQLLETVGSWLFDAERRVIGERESIERMKNLQISADEMFRLIGLLTAIRVKCDTSIKEIRETKRDYPLNQAQITKLVENMILTYHNNNVITLWDLYDSATNLYKADAMDIPQILPQNRAMVAFIKEQYPSIITID